MTLISLNAGLYPRNDALPLACSRQKADSNDSWRLSTYAFKSLLYDTEIRRQSSQ